MAMDGRFRCLIYNHGRHIPPTHSLKNLPLPMGTEDKCAIWG